MKKLLLAFSLLAGTSLFAQPYWPLLDSVNLWTYTSNMIPIVAHPPDDDTPQLQAAFLPCSYGNAFYEADYHETVGDTIIDSLAYKILIERDLIFNPFGCLFGYLREDTAQRKVFFRDNMLSPEILLYDFSMLPGDTFSMTQQVNNGGYYHTGNYILDSITTVTLFSGQHRKFWLHYTGSSFAPRLDWIEGVGSDKHLVYPYGPNWNGGGLFGNCSSVSFNDYAQILICFDHLSKVYWDSCAHALAFQNGCFQYQDSCNFWNICGGIEEFADDASFSLFPNPSNDRVTVSLDVYKAGNYTVLLRDITGKQVLHEYRLGILGTGTQRHELDLSDYVPGFYLVECRSEDGFMIKRLIRN